MSIQRWLFVHTNTWKLNFMKTVASLEIDDYVWSNDAEQLNKGLLYYFTVGSMWGWSLEDASRKCVVKQFVWARKAVGTRVGCLVWCSNPLVLGRRLDSDERCRSKWGVKIQWFWAGDLIALNYARKKWYSVLMLAGNWREMNNYAGKNSLQSSPGWQHYNTVSGWRYFHYQFILNSHERYTSNPGFK